MGKKVISFSLYGKQPKYTMGAVANARHANRAYPGWVCRFYVADDVPKGIVSRLHAHGAEVVNMGQRFGHEAMLWRLFAAFEPENEIVIFRDTDSRFVKCELVMVNEWLASNKKFHVMRSDALEAPIMAGLWGVRGAVPQIRTPMEKQLRSANSWEHGEDLRFLRSSLYPLVTGDVFIHEMYSQEKRRYFTEEDIHPFPSIAYEERGKYLTDHLPVGLRVPYGRTFIVLSIYKRTPFSEYFLVQLLNILEKRNLFRNLEIRFYVADNIRPDLIERLGRLGQVVLRSAETVHKDDPQYWKLSVLSEKNLGVAIIVDFWQFLLLVRGSRWKLIFYESLPIEHGRQPIGIKSQFRRIYPPSFYGPAIPVVDIDNLVVQRNPDKSYWEFVRLVVYPRTPTSRMVGVLLGEPDGAGFIKSWLKILFPVWLHNAVSKFEGYLKICVSSLKR